MIKMKTPIVLKIILTILSLDFILVFSLEDRDYWNSIGENEIKNSLLTKRNENTAKNVILFVGDGMSVDTVTASRIYQKDETNYLSWEKFPHVGLLKTYNTNKRVPDSASTATALFSGVKTNYKVVGVDVNVELDDCEASLNQSHHLSSIFDWAQSVGKATGFVTTTRVTHATPAALYAHSPNRGWECENRIPIDKKKCQDIAQQLIKTPTGRSINVIMGGGRQMLVSNATGDQLDPIDTWACYSTDGRNLIEDWKADKKLRKHSYQVVENNEQLRSLNPNKVDFLLGVFANGHLSMDWRRDNGPKGQPSLEEMTVMAINILKKNHQGYLLVVEGGLIDFAHHRGHAAQALRETIRMSDAVHASMKLINPDDTLVIVTSDHSHSMSINGYSDRKTSILGVAQKSKYDGTPFTTLLYSTGGLNNMAYAVDSTGNVTRMDPTIVNTSDFSYSQQAVVITDEAYHGGGDIAVYAQGPFAHLFHSTHEQNYVAHVIAYASKIGPYSSGSNLMKMNQVLVLTVAFITLHYIFSFTLFNS